MSRLCLALVAILMLCNLACAQTRSPRLEALSWAYAASHEQVCAVDPSGVMRWQTTIPVIGFNSLADFTLMPEGKLWVLQVFPPQLHRLDAVNGAIETTVLIPSAGLGTRLLAMSRNRFGELALLIQTPDPQAYGGWREELALFDTATLQMIWRMDIEADLSIDTRTLGLIPSRILCDRNGGIWVLNEHANIPSFTGSAPFTGGRLLLFDRQGTLRHSSPRGGYDFVLTLDDELMVIFRGNFEVDLYRISLDGSLVRRQRLPRFTLVNGNVESRYVTHPSGAIFLSATWPHPAPVLIEFIPPEPLPGTTGLGMYEFGTGEAERPLNTTRCCDGQRTSVTMGVDGHPWVNYTTDGLGTLVLARLSHVAATPRNGYPGFLIDFEVTIPTSLPPLNSSYPRPNTGWTMYHYCISTDPTGDLDGDGTPNRHELMEGTDPTDPASVGTTATVNLPLVPGATGEIEIRAMGAAGASYVSYVDVTSSTLSLPGGRAIQPDPFSFLATLWLDPTLAWTTNAIGTLGPDPSSPGDGHARVTFPVPTDPALRGATIAFGHVILDPNAPFAIKNAAGPLTITL